MPAVLLVEDDVLQVPIVRQALEGAGYAVDCARTGAEALVRVSRGGYAAIVIEMTLEATDGFEILNRLRDGGCALPIVATSAGGPMIAEDYLRVARLLGASRTLAKPYPVASLVALLTELLAAAG